MHERRGGGGSMQNTTFFTPINIIRRAATEIIADFDAAASGSLAPLARHQAISGSRSPLDGKSAR